MTTKSGLTALMREPAEELAFNMGVTLRGLTIKVKPTGYLMVVKITRRIDGHQVCFIEMPTLYDCWDYLYRHYTATNAPLSWRRDNWA